MNTLSVVIWLLVILTISFTFLTWSIGLKGWTQDKDEHDDDRG